MCRGLCTAYLTAVFPKQALLFTCLQHKTFENTVGKGEIARNEKFLLSTQCFFFTFKIAFSHFYQISNYRLPTLSVGRV